jgi:hypothetical protein
MNQSLKIFSHWNRQTKEWISNYQVANLWPSRSNFGWQTRDFVGKLQLILNKNTTEYPLDFQEYNTHSRDGYYLIYYGTSSQILEHQGLMCLDLEIIKKINQGDLKLLIAFTHETFDTGVSTQEWFSHFCCNLTEIGITKGQSVVILTGTQFRARFVNDWRCSFVFYPWFEADLQTSFKLVNQKQNEIEFDKKTKCFINFNNVIRPHRFLMVMYLQYANMADLGHVSWHNPDSKSWREILGEKSFGAGGMNWENQLDKFDRSGMSFYKFIKQINVLDSMHVDNIKQLGPGTHHGSSWVGGGECYQSALVDLCSETHVELYGDVFLTEKTFKPMAYGLPYVFMASKNHLHTVKSLGYQSFPELFDESYDSMSASLEKIVAVGTQIVEFSLSKEKQHMLKARPDIKEKLIYNQNLFWGKNHAQEISKLLHDAWNIKGA